MVIWFFTREKSHHYFKVLQVLLSNWKIMTEQLTGATSIAMIVRLLDQTPLISMMQQHQNLLQIMLNIKFNCTSEMLSRIMSRFYRLSQALEDVRACRHTKLEHVSLCTTDTATCHWVQSSRVKSHLEQHISPRSPLQRSALSWTTSSHDDFFLFPQQEVTTTCSDNGISSASIAHSDIRNCDRITCYLDLMCYNTYLRRH